MHVLELVFQAIFLFPHGPYFCLNKNLHEDVKVLLQAAGTDRGSGARRKVAHFSDVTAPRGTGPSTGPSTGRSAVRLGGRAGTGSLGPLRLNVRGRPAKGWTPRCQEGLAEAEGLRGHGRAHLLLEVIMVGGKVVVLTSHTGSVLPPDDLGEIIQSTSSRACSFPTAETCHLARLL